MKCLDDGRGSSEKVAVKKRPNGFLLHTIYCASGKLKKTSQEIISQESLHSLSEDENNRGRGRERNRDRERKQVKFYGIFNNQRFFFFSLSTPYPIQLMNEVSPPLQQKNEWMNETFLTVLFLSIILFSLITHFLNAAKLFFFCFFSLKQQETILLLSTHLIFKWKSKLFIIVVFLFFARSSLAFSSTAQHFFSFGGAFLHARQPLSLSSPFFLPFVIIPKKKTLASSTAIDCNIT